MKPLRFLITAGPTREFFDPIRYLTNRSSGKMGYALARAAAKVGQVTLITGPVALKPPSGIEVVAVTTAAEMARAVFRRYPTADVVIMAAAVCDYRPKQKSHQKLKKTGQTLKLELEPTQDILRELGRRKRRFTPRRAGQVLIGFAAETHDLETHAHDKLRRKNLDLIVANGVSAFEGDTNRVTLLYRNGTVERLPEQSKARVARSIVKRVTGLLTDR